MCLCQTVNPLFYANSVKANEEMYLPVDITITRVFELLLYQCRRSAHVKSFVTIYAIKIAVSITLFLFWVKVTRVKLSSLML